MGFSRLLPAFPEEWLRRLWTRLDLLRTPLRTLDGRSVKVLSIGVPNDGDGPDFLNATLSFDDAPVRGDVEFHLRTEDWYAHRHHLDPRYRRVALHVVLEHTDEGFFVSCAGDVPIPVLEMRTFLKIPLGALAEELGKDKVQRECPLPDDVSRDSIIERLRRDFAETRLLRKVERFRERAVVRGAEGAFYELLADALGYSNNRVPFAKLVERVPLSSFAGKTGVEAEATLFGAAGLLPSQRVDISADDSYVQELETVWANLHDKPIPLFAEEWHTFPVRQGNTPARRVAALARLVARSDGGFLPRLTALADGRDWRKRWREFQVVADDYWATHSDFGNETSSKASRLVGEMRERDIWVNVALPALYYHADESDDAPLRNRVLVLYREHPALQSNHKTRWIEQHVLRQPTDASAALQQGMLELYDHFCEPRRCAECPLRTEK